ncbi:MAG: lytic transglycosylase domain-containing protein [Desulfovibrio sp.]|jgi:soluble lytic murein transglycosylase-like protein|nr:lytic transglycosylase domain-containing protein [Desulfovibrio sp.]
MRFVALLLLSATTAFAGGVDQEKLVSVACARWNVPQKLVLAIIARESGHHPWAVNVAGRAHLPSSRDEALRIANAAWAAGKSFDLGLMQINSYWLKRFGFSPEYVLEPRRNVIIGTWILSREIARHGLSWKAVAGYHTPDAERGKRYAVSILKHLRGMK